MSSASKQFALERALQSLRGLSIGDAFGEMFFLPVEEFEAVLRARVIPAAPWSYTDDTEMALSVVAVLGNHAEIRQDELMLMFAEHFDLSRGYGPSMQRVLRQIQEGADWQSTVSGAFEGQGSYGNGSAMRAGPVGAYFADDLEMVVEQARRSSLVTHRHPEAVAGAVFVALAAAHVWRLREQKQEVTPKAFLELVCSHVPESEVLSKLKRASRLPESTSAQLAASILGNGEKLSAQDTVPFCLWCVARYLSDYAEALWETVSAGGDRDTTCAIVGSIVAMSLDRQELNVWLAAREPYPRWFTSALGE